jgi:hypothetical protein
MWHPQACSPGFHAPKQAAVAVLILVTSRLTPQASLGPACP